MPEELKQRLRGFPSGATDAEAGSDNSNVSQLVALLPLGDNLGLRTPAGMERPLGGSTLRQRAGSAASDDSKEADSRQTSRAQALSRDAPVEARFPAEEATCSGSLRRDGEG